MSRIDVERRRRKHTNRDVAEGLAIAHRIATEILESIKEDEQ